MVPTVENPGRGALRSSSDFKDWHFCYVDIFYSTNRNEVTSTPLSSSCVTEGVRCVPTKICVLVVSTSIVQSCSDRKFMTSSLVIYQVSTSSLLGNLDSWFVSMGMVYCSVKEFVTVVRTCSRLIETCVGLTTSLYTGTLNWFWKYPWTIDRT